MTLDLGIDISGGERAEYLQRQADYVLAVITDKVSEALGNCGIMFKPNGNNVDYIEQEICTNRDGQQRQYSWVCVPEPDRLRRLAVYALRVA